MTQRLGTACVVIATALACFVGASAQDSSATRADRGADGGAGKRAAARKSHEVRDLQMTLLRVEPGEFRMGSPPDEASRATDEAQHTVKLTKPFYLAATEVSQWQYEAVMGENPSVFKDADRPVENVSWSQAAAFCLELSRREGRRFRLPTEAEWEYAARAGRAGPIAGTGVLDEMAWHADNSGDVKLDSANLWDTDPKNYFKRLSDNGCKPRLVGTGTANDWGFHDMQGNVSEWVADWYEDDYYAQDEAKLDPPGPNQSEFKSRVIRGGSWGSDPRNCRVANRDYNVPKMQSPSCGFRVAMDAE